MYVAMYVCYDIDMETIIKITWVGWSNLTKLTGGMSAIERGVCFNQTTNMVCYQNPNL